MLAFVLAVYWHIFLAHVGLHLVSPVQAIVSILDYLWQAIVSYLVCPVQAKNWPPEEKEGIGPECQSVLRATGLSCFSIFLCFCIRLFSSWHTYCKTVLVPIRLFAS